MIGRMIAATAAVTLALGAAAPRSMASGEFIWPVGGRINSTHIYSNGTRHSGSADIGAPSWTQIGAGRQGNASAYWQSGGCGYYVYMSHGSGYNTNYCHMVRWPSVSGGAYVNRNQLVGYVGSTGWSTGPHLHYTIYRWGARLIIPNIWFGLYVTRGNYVPGTYSGLSGSTTSSVLFRAKVTTSGLNVRTGPGTGYGIVGSLGYGSIVNVYGTSGSWYKILYGGYYRWIAGWYTVRV